MAPAEAQAESQAEPSECRLRLTEELAIAPSVAPIDLPGGCLVADVVRLETVILRDRSRVAVMPPATLRCSMAEAIVRWVREDVAAAVRELGASLRGLDNYASFDCRGRNNIAGAKLSEHGHANAIDIAAFLLADGRAVDVKGGWWGGLAERNFLRDVRASTQQMGASTAPRPDLFSACRVRPRR